MKDKINKSKKIKFTFNAQKVTRYFYFLTFISTLIILFYVSSFLYTNFYQTITQSEIILTLQEKVASDTVNIDRFNKIIKIIDDKTDKRDIGDIRNPFE